MDVNELKGVSHELASSLHALGLENTAQFLAAMGHPAARSELAVALEVECEVLVGLANRADLLRISGLDEAAADLLALAGVDTVAELRRRIPENLYARLILVARRQQLPALPRLEELQRWVQEARQMERVIYYE
jgi:signal transduction histidine kinase